MVGAEPSISPVQAKHRMIIVVRALARIAVAKSGVILSSDVNVLLELRHRG